MYLASIKQLQYFIALMELQHFSHAAERCFVSQSTLSAAISELENILDTQLFERTNRKVLPTHAAFKLLETAQEIIKLSKTLTDQVTTSKQPLSGKLSLGTIPTIAPFLLPKILPELRQTYPDLALSLIEDTSLNILKRIKEGDLDCGILALPFDLTAFNYKTFYEENFFVVAPKGHPLESFDKIQSNQIPVDQLLLLEEGHCLRDHALSACKFKNRQSEIKFQGTSIYTLIQMVLGGQGVTLIPQMALNSSNFDMDNVATIELAEPGPHRVLALVWRKSFYRAQDLLLLTKKLEEILNQE